MQTIQQAMRTIKNWLARGIVSFLLLLISVPAWAFVDLVPTAVSTAAAILDAGSPFTISYTVKNQGTAAGTYDTYTYFYLSTDPANAQITKYWVGYQRLSPLGGGASATNSATARAGSTLPSGTYYIIAVADASGNTQPESDETNNTLVGGTVVVVNDVDLIPIAVSAAEGSVATGGSLTISYTVKNQGTTRATYNTGGFYLSADTTITESDTLIGGWKGPQLAGGATDSGLVTATVPANLAPGTYHIGMIADDYTYNHIQPETNETNNALTGAQIPVYSMIAPAAPIIGTATGGNAQATVTFSAPAPNGGPPITGYTVTSNPGNITATGTASPITVTGLATGTAYTFTVTAANAAGTGLPSAASNSITPAAAGLQVYYIHADHLDTPRVITDTAGNKVWEWQNTDPFGNNMPDQNPSNLGTFEFDLRFPGQVADKETNTFYNINRDLDPATGRYLEFDPIGLDGGINGFIYVEDNPLSYTDMLGLKVDLVKMMKWMREHATKKPRGVCAKNYREGFEAGGGDSTGHPRSAKDWGGTLEKNDFTKISPENYAPKVGDTMVFQPTPGHDDGHIQAYDGSKWVSDYIQNNTIPPSFKSGTYTTYRSQ